MGKAREAFVSRSPDVSSLLLLKNPAQVSCGLPQGSNLGPLLFLVYINDLPNCLSLTSPRMFADDRNITFAASTMADLENTMHKLGTWKSLIAGL